MRELMTPINTPDEQFHGGNPSKGDACTVVTAKWLNDVQASVRSNQDELLSVLAAAVMEADPGKKDQVLEALSKLFIRRSSGIGYYATVPVQQAEPIVYVPPFGLMHWQESAKMYRSVDCGAIILHPSATPRAGTIKANGAVLSKTGYAGLWLWATENDLVVASENWMAGTAMYADMGGDNFRIPELRGEFFRAWDDGRGADVGRSSGSWQKGTPTTVDTVFNDGTARHLHIINVKVGTPGHTDYSNVAADFGADQIINVDYNKCGATNSIGFENSTEYSSLSSVYTTRPRNVALTACIKY